MKEKLNWQSKQVVAVFDEATLWAAPFGRMLLENIPMKPKYNVLDIGFGTGLPLIELSQRFGSDAQIYGIDVWKEGIELTNQKINTFGINNIQLFEQSATRIPLEENTLDLVCSNLGVNNFEEKEKILQEINRVLKKKGTLAITTNPIGTFKELFDLFETVFTEMELAESQDQLESYIHHRGTQEGIIKEIETYGFKLEKVVRDETNMRFVNATALLDHALIRIGFREGWEKLVPESQSANFFKNLIHHLDQIIQAKGEFKMSIPMLYLQFSKP